jgi:hypothetical protein
VVKKLIYPFAVTTVISSSAVNIGYLKLITALTYLKVNGQPTRRYNRHVYRLRRKPTGGNMLPYLEL